MTESGRLIRKLHRIYNESVDRDVFGNRKATAREIEQAIHPDFKRDWQDHLPVQEDLNDKNEGV